MSCHQHMQRERVKDSSREFKSYCSLNFSNSRTSTMSNLCSLVISPLRCLWFSLCILFLWVVAPTTHVELSGLEYPEDCWDRQSRSMCETNRANNNRTFRTTRSGFKDTSTRLRCLNCREEELRGATNPERWYFRKQVGRFRGSKVWSHLQYFIMRLRNILN